MSVAEEPDHDMVAEDVYHLRKAGYSYENIRTAIFERWGVSYSVSKVATIFNQFRVSLAEAYGLEDRKAMLFLELERLDAMQQAYWPAMEKGDVQSGRMILDLMKNRQMLTGMDTINAADRQNVVAVLIAGQDRNSFIEALAHGREQPSESKLIEVASQDLEDGEVTEEAHD